MLIADLPEPQVTDMPMGEDDLYEVLEGRRVELPPMGAYESKIASVLLIELGQFAQARGLGQAVVELLFRLRSEPNLQRRPDAAFVSFERWPRGKRIPPGNAWDVVPDLVVEVVSPTNFAEEIPTKVREYFEAGVRRAWIVYPHESLVYEYDSPRSIRVLGLGDALEGGSILPGFQLALADLFDGPEQPPTAEPA